MNKKFIVLGLVIALLVIAWVVFVLVGSYSQDQLPVDAGYDSRIDGQSDYRRCVDSSGNQIVYQWFSCTPENCSETYYDVNGSIMATYDAMGLSSGERDSFLQSLQSCVDISQGQFEDALGL